MEIERELYDAAFSDWKNWINCGLIAIGWNNDVTRRRFSKRPFKVVEMCAFLVALPQSCKSTRLINRNDLLVHTKNESTLYKCTKRSKEAEQYRIEWIKAIYMYTMVDQRCPLPSSTNMANLHVKQIYNRLRLVYNSKCTGPLYIRLTVMAWRQQ